MSVGVFGKLPGRGDFITHGVGPAFTEPWHLWLARELPAARAGLGPRFEPAYLQAPAWRFALADGLAGPAMTGVLIPSVDAVGREFPLTLASKGGIAGTDWYEAVDELARAALDDDWTLEPWLAALAAVADPAVGPVQAGAVFWGEGSPFVAPGEQHFTTLPTGEAFLGLLRDREATAA